MREGTVRSNDGWAVTEYVPNAVFGLSLDQLPGQRFILKEVVVLRRRSRDPFEAHFY